MQTADPRVTADIAKVWGICLAAISNVEAEDPEEERLPAGSSYLQVHGRLYALETGAARSQGCSNLTPVINAIAPGEEYLQEKHHVQLEDSLA